MVSSDDAILSALPCDTSPEADHDDEANWHDLGALVSGLLQADAHPKDADAGHHAPADVFNYWDQPRPPEDVARCLVSWKATGLPVHTYDRDSADDHTG